MSLLGFDGVGKRCVAPMRRTIGHRPGRHVLKPCSECAAARTSQRASKLL
ncbi:acetyltransferase, gnat family [Burkholderia pseudomallei 406e]|uniref:Uncharacterized protein n=1 Tax=Burkholderia pseudomallei 1710a TaxID=320371 RepID=A0A0E1W2Q8_BURPE|nr:acetyltransferase, gnat family [Burkholderia pseudomallei 406e]EDU08741.1 conserved hypothetical protein [Burkholderia pseudomallei 1655]EET07505.1 conserved hypothetical protein [Burkholderia pseudomallei 1710a]